MLRWFPIFISLQSVLFGTAQASDAPSTFDNQIEQIKKINSPACLADARGVSGKLKGACSDLAKFACRPGESDDGTGVFRSSEDVEAEVASVQKELKAKLQTVIEKALERNDPQGQALRSLEQNAVMQNARPECKSNESAKRKQCDSRTAALLAKVISKNSLSQYTLSNADDSFSDKVSLRTLDLNSFEQLLGDTHFRQIVEPVQSSVKRKLVQDNLRNKIETTIFPQVKALLIEKIRQSVTDSNTQKLMVAKIQKINFDGGPCIVPAPGTGSGRMKLDPIFIRQAFYSPDRNSFQICNGQLLRSSSEFSLVAMITHELTHSIDPCGIVWSPELKSIYSNVNSESQCNKEYPFKSLIACLRTEESVGAARAEWTVEKKYRKFEKGTAPVAFCNGDQIGESVSDWMSAEILPEYMDRFHPELSSQQKIRGYANSVRLLCPRKDFAESPGDALFKQFDPHPDFAQRVTRLLAANERVFYGMGCKNVDRKSAPVHCVPGAPVTGKSKEAALEKIADDRAAQRELKNKGIK